MKKGTQFTKRLLAVALCLCMVMSSFTGVVYAEEGDTPAPQAVVETEATGSETDTTGVTADAAGDETGTADGETGTTAPETDVTGGEADTTTDTTAPETDVTGGEADTTTDTTAPETDVTGGEADTATDTTAPETDVTGGEETVTPEKPAEAETETPAEDEQQTPNDGDSVVAPLEVTTPTSATIALQADQNPVLQNPADFEIGKTGTKNFNIVVSAKPVKQGEGTKRALGIVIPKGFSIVSAPTINFVNKGDTDDGKGVLWVHEYTDTEEVAITELSLTIQQDAKYLLENLTVGDSYDFIATNYYNYGQEDQAIASFDTLSLVPNTADAIQNVTATVDTVAIVPNTLGSYAGTSRNLPIASDFWGDLWSYNITPGYEVTITKTAGHLPTDLNITLPTDFAPDGLGGSNAFYCFTNAWITADGINVSQPGMLDHGSNEYTIDMLGFARDWSSVTVKGKSTTLLDVLREATEITFSIGLKVYPNKLDFAATPGTTYTTATDIAYSYTDHSATEQDGTADQLNFVATNGTDTSVTLNHLKTTANTVLASLAEQRMDTTKSLNEFVQFSTETDYAIISNAKVLYEFPEEYSPVAFTKLHTEADYNLTYTITITNVNGGTRTIVRNPGDAASVTATDLNLTSTEYVSSVEITSPRLWHNVSVSSTDPAFVADYKALSTSLDGVTTYKDGHVANMKTTVTGDNIDAPIASDYSIKLIKVQDNLLTNVLDLSTVTEVVNEHNKTIVIGTYFVVKYKDTMEYGQNDDEMPEVVLRGPAIGLVDRVAVGNHKLVGYQDENGTWHDISAIAEDHLVADDMYNNSGTVVVHRSYDLKAIINATLNGGSYAQAIKTSLNDINDWDPLSLNEVSRNFYLGASKVCPGYLNYDALFGGTTKADLPAGPFHYEADLDCNWSGEDQDVENEQDTKHVAGIQGESPVFINGNYVTAANWEKLDFFYTPGSINHLSYAFAEKSEASLGELSTTQTIASHQTMNFHDAYIDFAGTDPDLLALTEYIRVQTKSHTNTHWAHFLAEEKLTVEYTTNANPGQTKTADISFENTSFYEIRYISMDLRNLLVDENDYFTSIKIKIPEEVAFSWVQDSNKDLAFPDICLGRVSNLPATYPVSGKTVGTKTDVDGEGSDYDRLPVKATVYAKDLFGNEVTNLTVEGNSSKLQTPTLYIDAVYTVGGNYDSNVISQGQHTTFTWYSGFNSLTTSSIDPDKQFFPIYYLKVDKDFVYDGTFRVGHNGVAYTQATSAEVVRFVEAGTGANQSGDPDFGYLILDMSRLGTVKMSAGGAAYWTNNWRIGLVSKSNAKLGTDRVPVVGVWMDIPYDRAQPASATQSYKIDTSNTVDTAPYGDVFGNTPATTTTPAKLDETGKKALMLYQPIVGQMTVNKAVIVGISQIAKAEQPLAYGDAVTSRDYTATENLFDADVFVSGSESNPTYNWVLYLPVPKKDGAVGGKTNGYSLDLMSVDTTKFDQTLTDAGVPTCIVEYSTKATPSTAGAAGGTDPAGEYTATANMADVTMVRVTIPELPQNCKEYVYLNFKLDEHKTEVGDQHAYFTPTGNAKMDGQWLSTNGFTLTTPLDYVLSDFSITGMVWDETDTNSLYNAGTDTLVSSVEMNAYAQGDTTPLTQTGNTKFTTDAKGVYTLLVPTDGKYDVKAKLPDGKGFVKQFVTTGVAATAHNADESWANRTTGVATVDVAQTAGTSTTVKDVNVGLYTVPTIELDPAGVKMHVGETTGTTVTATVNNQAAGTTVSYALKAGANTGIVTLTDNTDGTATVTTNGKSTGVVTGVASVDDGYGGTVTAEFTATDYSNVSYDGKNYRANTAGTAPTDGTVPTDTNEYFPSADDADSDLVTVATGAPTMDGYRFMGWNTDKAAATAGTVQYKAADTFHTGSVSADTTLYAVWKPVYTVTWVNNDTSKGSIATNPESNPITEQVLEGGKPTLTVTPTPASEYEFTGWKILTKDTQGDFTVDGGTTDNYKNLVINADTQLEPIFTLTPYITINAVNSTEDGANHGHVSIKEGTTAATVGTATTATIDKDGWASTGDKDATVAFKAAAHSYIAEITLSWPSLNDANTNVSLTGEDIKTGEISGLPTTVTADGTTFTMTITTPATGAQGPAEGSIVIEGLKRGTIVNVRFELESYTVDFDMDGGTAPTGGETDDQTVLYNGNATKPTANPTKTGYTFDGWSKDGTTEFAFTTAITEDTTLTALWTPITYNIHFNGNGTDVTGSTATMSNIKYDEAKNLTANGFVNPGYHFTGWATTAGAAKVYDDKESVTNLSSTQGATVELYAVWEANTPVTNDPPVSKKITVTEVAPATKTTFTFEMKPDSTTATGITKATMPMPAGSTAQVKQVTIEGEGSKEFGELSFTVPGTYIYKVSEVNDGVANYAYDGTVYTVTYEVAFKADGTTLECTRTFSDGTGTKDGAVFTNVYTLKTYTVSFDADGGNYTPADQKVTDGDTATKPADPTKAGFTFAGWYLPDGTEYDFTTPVTGNVQLKAHWDKIVIHTVSFDSDGGNYTPDDQKVTDGDTATKPKNPTKQGSSFEGWYLPDGTKYEFSTPVTGDVKLTAHWTKDTVYKVSFDSDGGNYTPEDQEIAEGGTATKPTDPTKKGFTFDGWYLPDGTKYDFNTPVTGDVKLTAHWTKALIHKVEFNPAGGNFTPPTQYVEHGKLSYDPQNPGSNGLMTFVGWFNTKDGTRFDFSTPITEDVKLIACWRDNDGHSPDPTPNPNNGNVTGPTGTTTTTVITIPRTGDETPFGLLFGLLAIGAAGFVGLVLMRKRRNGKQ